MSAKGYVICTEPRSGSNFLCQALASTGCLGRPLEYFNAAGRRLFEDPSYPEESEAQLREILARGASSNGVYGLKIFSHQFDRVASLRWAERLPGLRFILLERRDLVGQAISRVRADQSGQFRAGAPSSGQAPRYDQGAITARLHEIAIGYARWRAYFAQNDLTPLRLDYEDVVADPQGAVQRVAALLEEPLTASFRASAIDLQIQRDELSGAWRERYLAEVQFLGALPRLGSPRLALARRWSGLQRRFGRWNGEAG